MTVSKAFFISLFDVVHANLLTKVIPVGGKIYYLRPGFWTLGFNKSKKCAGMCYSNGKITISSNLLGSPTITVGEVLETILHEFAHAIAGCENGHNSVWKLIAGSIGSSAEQFCNPFAEERFSVYCPAGCYYRRHHLSKKVFLKRKMGHACCKKHKNLPVFVYDKVMSRRVITVSPNSDAKYHVTRTTTGLKIRPTTNLTPLSDYVHFGKITATG
jgi:hypothetical protein